ncbi:MAG: DUF3011 domain-containing protein [Xanthomonadaceae bacterium]|jgi:hypothetical protein|nr:DUF3011 domain-containing protein [Xanthomonadaceae bacterium]
MRLGVMLVGSLLAGLLLLGASRPALAQYGGVVRCESRDFRDNYCPVNTRGGVRLLRQISRSDCWEGETWGYDRRGIWVTQGCAAEFEVGGARGGYDDGYGRGRGGDWDDGYGRGRYDDDRGAQRILCESRDFRYNYCPVRVPRDVDLVYQQSKSECRFNRSWGWDRGGIWVDRGCAAEFVVY